jgi:hypothetical protein
VIPVGENLAATPKLAVDGPRNTNRQTLHTTRQRTPIFSLREQVQVIALDAKVHQPKAKALTAGNEGAAHLQEQLVLTQCS